MDKMYSLSTSSSRDPVQVHQDQDQGQVGEEQGAGPEVLQAADLCPWGWEEQKERVKKCFLEHTQDGYDVHLQRDGGKDLCLCIKD